MSELITKGAAAKKASKLSKQLSTEQKNGALAILADLLLSEQEMLISENNKDLEAGRQNGISVAILDRLALSPKRIEDMAEGLRQVIELEDPIGELIEAFTRPNNLRIEKVRVPLGVVGMIYEARPNVTIDAAALCIKTGNAVLLRGSSSAIHSNKALVSLIQRALREAGISEDTVVLLEDTSRETSDQMLRLNEYLDVLIPRGGASLIQHVVKNATVPVLETGAGNCHVYIEQDADPAKAFPIVINAKTHRPAVCNAIETLLVQEQWAEEHLYKLLTELKERGVQIRGCSKTVSLFPTALFASEEDYATEYNDLILAVKCVDNIDEAMAHIDQYGTHHSECIVTESAEKAKLFLSVVDAAAVYHNASTRFTDGFEFGFGAEIGISTQKLHARGPMGLVALTSYKYLLHGDGQIRS